MAGALGELNIDLSANIAKFESAMEKAAYLAQTSMDKVAAAMQAAEAHAKLLEGALGTLGTSLSALGVIAGAGAFVEMVKGSIESAAQMKHLSEQTGVSVSALSAMKLAAKLVGVDLQEAALMASKLDKAMWQAQGGNQQAQSSFEKLGVKAMDANGRLRETESVLMDAAKRFEVMESGAAKTALAQELFGKTGSKMIPLLEQLAEKGDLNGKVTEHQAEVALHLEQSWLKLQGAMNSWKFGAMETIAPALELLIPILPALTTGVIGFIGVVKILPAAIGGITSAMRVMQAATSLAGLTGLGVFAGLTTAVEAFTVAIAANPLGALAVAALAIGSALYLLQDHMVSLGDTTASVGNWLGGVWDTINDGANRLLTLVSPIAKSVWSTLSSVATSIFDFYAGNYQSIWGFITGVYDNIANIARGTYESMTGWLKDAINALSMCTTWWLVFLARSRRFRMRFGMTLQSTPLSVRRLKPRQHPKSQRWLRPSIQVRARKIHLPLKCKAWDARTQAFNLPLIPGTNTQARSKRARSQWPSSIWSSENSLLLSASWKVFLR